MIGNALLLALTLFMAFGFVLMDRLKFLIPYRQVIFHNCGWAIGLYAVLLFANLFAAFFLLARRFFLKHTGQKLVYVDRQGWKAGLNIPRTKDPKGNLILLSFTK